MVVAQADETPVASPPTPAPQAAEIDLSTVAPSSGLTDDLPIAQASFKMLNCMDWLKLKLSAFSNKPDDAPLIENLFFSHSEASIIDASHRPLEWTRDTTKLHDDGEESVRRQFFSNRVLTVRAVIDTKPDDASQPPNSDDTDANNNPPNDPPPPPPLGDDDGSEPPDNNPPPPPPPPPLPALAFAVGGLFSSSLTVTATGVGTGNTPELDITINNQLLVDNWKLLPASGTQMINVISYLGAAGMQTIDVKYSNDQSTTSIQNLAVSLNGVAENLSNHVFDPSSGAGQVAHANSLSVNGTLEMTVVNTTSARGQLDVLPVAMMNQAIPLIIDTSSIDATAWSSVVFIISGIPSGGQAIPGTYVNGVWHVSWAQANNTALAMPNNFVGDVNLTITALATHNDGRTQTAVQAYDMLVVNPARMDVDAYLNLLIDDDIVDARMMHDDINGTTSHDFLFGGLGHDDLWGNNGNDVLDGGTGKDTLNGGNGTDVLIGGAGHDELTGGSQADWFVFDAASDQGDDIITDYNQNNGDLLMFRIADTNNDNRFTMSDLDYTGWANVGGGKIIIYMGDDSITVNAQSAHKLNWGFAGSKGDDIIQALTNTNIQAPVTVFANDGDDQIEGGLGNDHLYGEAGADTLVGGDGSDNLWGGAGNDIFSWSGSVSSSSGRDTIKDFTNGSDIIDVRDILFIATNGSEFDDYLYFKNSGTLHSELMVDLDGAGNAYKAVSVALIENVRPTELDQSDLLLPSMLTTLLNG